ncbi:hypothetical protein HID58_020960 [Brassica napus]|uniref:Uncharacterized protein n=1 Tax=Brassica napus TaxID=3708 RepID=A0ABQ8CV11_BRANA|nr:hypothetical protein HID58_020960 [Brassica napus]
MCKCTHTLASASTKHKPISEDINYTIEIAYNVGDAIAKSCLEKGITKVAFDRGVLIHHDTEKTGCVNITKCSRLQDTKREDSTIFQGLVDVKENAYVFHTFQQ